MACGCNKKKNKAKVVRAYKNKHKITKKAATLKPSLTKEELRQQLLERMRKG